MKFLTTILAVLLSASLAFGKGGSFSSGSHSFSSGSHSFSSGGSHSFSSGASSSSSHISSSFGKSYSTGGSSNPVGHSYSSGGRSYSNSSGSTSTNSRKPSSTSFNSHMSDAANHETSRIHYQAATTPKSSYTSPTGHSHTISPDSPHVQTIRRYVTHERYITYDNRASSFYGGYYSHPMYYNDFYSPFLMSWLISDSINSHERAIWMYNHQNDMDSVRYQALLEKDGHLQAEINELKAKNTPVDPSYVPAQMQDNPDLMYHKDFVNASYNPVEVEDEGGNWSWIGWFFLIITVVIIGGIAVYFFCVKEY